MTDTGRGFLFSANARLHIATGRLHARSKNVRWPHMASAERESNSGLGGAYEFMLRALE